MAKPLRISVKRLKPSRSAVAGSSTSQVTVPIPTRPSEATARPMTAPPL